MKAVASQDTAQIVIFICDIINAFHIYKGYTFFFGIGHIKIEEYDIH
jgi:hypothetical protein